MTPDPSTVHPLSAHERVVFLKPLVDGTKVVAGDFTYYGDPDGATDFAQRNVLYAYGPERLITGKYCGITTGTRFLMTGAAHPSMGALVTEHARTIMAGSPKDIECIAATEDLEQQ
ncbi:hypothetical protein OG978_19590 [Streptomyces sp. NBC_01591]|uniref:hypothetical protein n=1 Tax=Streptomyces sp. NBC_01591 TaxID=2975888 RepID=UPI002DD8D6D5|nr:hypothetical protein [Streptomyces sp. NBC_01591]WSD69403.1 hypothetical protein OG978_19590 [Streptomyces sp. NBC_01591]